MRNMAKIVVTTKPIQTGRRFLLANSNGSTLQIAAAGINAQGTKVPLPIKDILLFCRDNYYFTVCTYTTFVFIFRIYNNGIK